MNATIGIDIGGTKTCAGVVDGAGRVLHHAIRPTPAQDGADAVLATAGDVAIEMLEWAACADVTVGGAGAGSAGTVDARGVISHATDSLPGWTGADVAGRLSERLNLNVRVINDVHAMALAEHRFGAAVGSATALVVAVGTGIGGAIVTAGALSAGRTGTAGAVGHLAVPAAEPRTCPCGRVGHVEAYASGPAIVADYISRGGAADNLEQVAANASAGDERACQAIASAGMTLGTALGGLSNVLDPDVIVIGGGVAQLGHLLFDPLNRALRAQTLPGPDTVAVRTAALGPLAGTVGAAILAVASQPE
jgi:glucokinase